MKVKISKVVLGFQSWFQWKVLGSFEFTKLCRGGDRIFDKILVKILIGEGSGRKFNMGELKGFLGIEEDLITNRILEKKK